MIKKILIANRGEIALRVIRTAKKMGIKTVAVFSERDRHAPHTALADEAIFIGPAASKDSYLKIDTLIAAAKQTGADAIHPGYGFLSENPLFANAVKQAGIIFIGPPASAMEQMGNKIIAKQTAKKMGVPLVPGTDEAIVNIEQAKKIANITSYPLLIKAAAGGGGKGMRLVHHEHELEEQMTTASNEAKSAFGDGSIFIEKYISKPRHIEIQLMCDSHGNGISLFERECSVQRRHQKIIEEAPSSCLTPAIRKSMGEDAVRLALACGYVGAGTVEFLVDENLNYYFLEMNTRLQVEHPVTEAITGLDLVEMQIDIANGKPLSIQEDELHISGHSMELRICAEDSMNNFLPSIGILTKYIPPKAAHIRLDDSYTSGMEIPIEYDPMIGKLIVHGKNRLDAIQKLKQAILDFQLEGIDTTLPFGLFVLNHPDFISGNFDTRFISLHYEEFIQQNNDPALLEALSYGALYAYLEKIQQLSPAQMNSTLWHTNRSVD